MYWEWGDWSSYYKGSSEKLGRAVDATALEACHCHRLDTPQTFTVEHQAGRIKEDREFILMPSPTNATARCKACSIDMQPYNSNIAVNEHPVNTGYHMHLTIS